MCAIGSFGWLNPQRSVSAVALLAIAVAFFSATQDVVLDAYKRELLPDHELGLGNAVYVNAYRASALIPGSLALILADHLPWPWVFVSVAAFMLVGIITSLCLAEGATEVEPPPTLAEAVIGPFREFFARQDRMTAATVLLFMFLYKFGDTLAAALLTPFYLDLGFSKTVIGTIAKGVVLPATLLGALAGGVSITRIGINRALWLFGILQLVSTLGFALLASIGPDTVALALVVAFEYLASGLGTSAFMAFLSRATDRRFTATQYALFSSLIALPRTVATASTGYLVEAVGYRSFFVACAAMAVPGLLLLGKVAPWGRVEPSAAPEAST
jgi:PAT family beta-lactamase induction signal transducer AmpG